MMNWIWAGLVILSVLFGIATGRVEALSEAAISSCGGAVTMVLGLCGALMLWSGMMKVADDAGLTLRLARLLTPLMRLIFRNFDPESASGRAICMNVSANLLGLGNAATPLGIKAMEELEREEGKTGVASDQMVLFVVLNTASLQLLPTTIATLRQNAGSQNPMEILPALLFASVITLTVSLAGAKLLAALPIGRKSLPSKRKQPTC